MYNNDNNFTTTTTTANNNNNNNPTITTTDHKNSNNYSKNYITYIAMFKSIMVISISLSILSLFQVLSIQTLIS